MKKILSLLVVIISSISVFAQVEKDTPPKQLKLVVGIVLDQMRWDYLQRYYSRYGNGGFKRLMEKGFNCQNTMINYLPSFTAPGHTCIYTGSVPALHGIAANEWIDKATSKEMYCTEDKTISSVGGGKAGLMSPQNLLATTITDELRLSTNFQSKTIGIAIKDRGAILPAGHAATAAFWYDDSNGNFISSSFYMQQLPEWLVRFNERNLNDSLMALNWNTLYPLASYTQSVADDNAYEGKFKWETTATFPHRTSVALEKNDKGSIRLTPYGNTITRLMTIAAIEGEQLGQRNFTDFIAVSFSSTDYIGHYFAPNSIEVEDCYLRMDEELELLLNFLDEKIGDGSYLVFLTADHGGAHNPSFLNDHHIAGKSISEKEANQSLNQFLYQKYNDSNIVLSLMNYQVYLNEEEILQRHFNRDELRNTIIDWLKTVPGIAFVLDMEHSDKNVVPQSIYQMAVNGYNAKRSGSIQIIMEPGWFSGYGNTGTTHGSWNPYDTHIPLLWYGWNIPKGETYREIYMTDIAPTLAALLHIQMPNACVGKPIIEILK